MFEGGRGFGGFEGNFGCLGEFGGFGVFIFGCEIDGCLKGFLGFLVSGFWWVCVLGNGLSEN